MVTEKIIQQVDSVLSEKILANSVFSPKVQYGLVETIVVLKDGLPHVLPVKMANGALSYVTPDDSFNTVTYHRNTRISYGKEPDSESYGEEDGKNVTMDFVFIVLANKIRTGMSGNKIEAMIGAFFPAQLTKEFIASIGMGKAAFSLQSTSSNSLEVFSSEYRGETYWLPENWVAIQANYQLTGSYEGECFNLCCDETTE